MSKTKTKRVKRWAIVDGVEAVGATYLNRPTWRHSGRVVRLVEVRPGDVVLSREDAEELRRIVEAYWMASGQTTTARDRAIALLRGCR